VAANWRFAELGALMRVKRHPGAAYALTNKARWLFALVGLGVGWELTRPVRSPGPTAPHGKRPGHRKNAPVLKKELPHRVIGLGGMIRALRICDSHKRAHIPRDEQRELASLLHDDIGAARWEPTCWESTTEPQNIVLLSWCRLNTLLNYL